MKRLFVTLLTLLIATALTAQRNYSEAIALGDKAFKAEYFDETGFTKVKRDGVDYLLDTLGNEYRVAYTIKDLLKYPSMVALDTRGTKLDSFPTAILNHKTLEVLILNGGYHPYENNFDIIPDAINQLPLKSLQLHYCGIDSLPMLSLNSLQSLYLSKNNLINIDGLKGANLQNLQYLELSYNKLTNIDALKDANLQSLQILDLSFNDNLINIDALKGANLQNLQYLELSGNYSLSNIDALKGANLKKPTILIPQR